MDTIVDVKEALAARSRTTTLDDLKSQGRKSVKVIRPEHIAAMVQEAVQKAVESSGLVSPDEVEKLVERGQEEFKHVIAERESQLNQLREAMRELEDVKAERVRLQASLDDAIRERDQLLERGAGAGTSMSEGAGGAQSSDLMMKLMNEVATLKANMLHGGGEHGGGGGEPGVTAAIDKLAGTLNDRLEKFGRKMGISSAIEADNINFDALFSKEVTDKKFESNIDSVQVKKKTEGGIAANLERLKKLKGDG